MAYDHHPPHLAAIRVASIGRSVVPGFQIATLVCESADKELSFETDTSLLDPIPSTRSNACKLTALPCLSLHPNCDTSTTKPS